VVLIHGMCCTPALWSNYETYLKARGYAVHVPALRWHDVSPSASVPEGLGTTSVLDYAADLEKLIRRLPEKPVLIGHSMGGLLAQILAARGLAKACILLTPAPPAGVFALAPIHLPVLLKTLATGAFWRKPFRPTWFESRFALLSLLPEVEARRVHATFVHESGRALAEIGFWPFDRRGASRVDRAAIDCPLLIVGAARDRITPVSVVRRIARYYGSKATYVELPGHAHWVLGEPGWEKIAEHCIAWIEKTTATASIDRHFKT
jgi:pimeloyl-ACP methyl ester carboxylesterase